MYSLRYQSINQSINQSIIYLFWAVQKTSKCTVQCRTGHKGMKHLQVPETNYHCFGFSFPGRHAVADPARDRGACPPLAAWQFFCQYINIITKPTAYDGPREY